MQRTFRFLHGRQARTERRRLPIADLGAAALRCGGSSLIGLGDLGVPCLEWVDLSLVAGEDIVSTGGGMYFWDT